MSSKVTLNAVKILWPNFRGIKDKFNPDGKRGFSALITDSKTAAALTADGWNVKPLKNESGVVDAWHLPIKVNLDSSRPARMFKLHDFGEPTPFDRITIEQLDTTQVEFADILFNAYPWSVQGNSGISAYLDTMYVKFEENELDRRWNAIFEDEFGGCELTEDMTIGRIYVCNRHTGKFEEVSRDYES